MRGSTLLPLMLVCLMACSEKGAPPAPASAPAPPVTTPAAPSEPQPAAGEASTPAPKAAPGGAEAPKGTPAPQPAPIPAPIPASVPAPSAAPSPEAASVAAPVPASPVQAAPPKPVAAPTGPVSLAANGHAAIGADKCRMCHRLQHDSWAAGAHAKKGLDCEACHGNGADYKSMSVMKNPAAAKAAGLVTPTLAFCGKCHGPKADAALYARVHAHKAK